MVDALLSYIGCTKGLHTWFHAAHHVTKGASFAGDHVNLYGEIYNGISEDFDKLVEKSIMVADTEEVACPIMITEVSAKVLSKYESPVVIETLMQLLLLVWNTCEITSKI